MKILYVQTGLRIIGIHQNVKDTAKTRAARANETAFETAEEKSVVPTSRVMVYTGVAAVYRIREVAF